VLETLIDTFQRQSGACAHAAVSVLDAANRVLQPLAVGDLPPAWIEELRRIAAAGEGMPGAAALVGECAFSADLEHETRWPEYRAAALRVGFRAAWSRGVGGGDGTALGTLDVVYTDPRTPGPDESHFVELLAETAAVAIERSRNEAELRFQAQILSRVHDAVVMIDAGGRIVQWNEGAARIFGFSAEDAVGRHVSALCAVPEDYRWLEEHIFAPLKRLGRLEITAPLKRRSGEVLHALLSLSLLTQHRRERPFGMAGGEPGLPGRQWVVSAGGEQRPLAGVDGCEVGSGDRLVIETPGGGGWGDAGPSVDSDAG